MLLFLIQFIGIIQLVLVSGERTRPQSAVCSINDVPYFLIMEPLHNHQARAKCHQYGKHLATVNSSNDLILISALIFECAVKTGFDTSAVWISSTGNSAQLQSLVHNSTCLAVDRLSGLVSTNKCGSSYGVICQDWPSAYPIQKGKLSGDLDKLPIDEVLEEVFSQTSSTYSHDDFSRKSSTTSDSSSHDTPTLQALANSQLSIDTLSSDLQEIQILNQQDTQIGSFEVGSDHTTTQEGIRRFDLQDGHLQIEETSEFSHSPSNTFDKETDEFSPQANRITVEQELNRDLRDTSTLSDDESLSLDTDSELSLVFSSVSTPSGTSSDSFETPIPSTPIQVPSSVTSIDGDSLDLSNFNLLGFRLILNQLPYEQAKPACQYFGMTLASVNFISYWPASIVVHQSSSARSMAWIDSAPNNSGSCIALRAASLGISGPRIQGVNCQQRLPVLCQGPVLASWNDLLHYSRFFEGFMRLIPQFENSPNITSILEQIFKDIKPLPQLPDFQTLINHTKSMVEAKIDQDKAKPSNMPRIFAETKEQGCSLNNLSFNRENEKPLAKFTQDNATMSLALMSFCGIKQATFVDDLMCHEVNDNGTIVHRPKALSSCNINSIYQLRQ